MNPIQQMLAFKDTFVEIAKMFKELAEAMRENTKATNRIADEIAAYNNYHMGNAHKPRL